MNKETTQLLKELYERQARQKRTPKTIVGILAGCAWTGSLITIMIYVLDIYNLDWTGWIFVGVFIYVSVGMGFGIRVAVDKGIEINKMPSK